MGTAVLLTTVTGTGPLFFSFNKEAFLPGGFPVLRQGYGTQRLVRGNKGGLPWGLLWGCGARAARLVTGVGSSASSYTQRPAFSLPSCSPQSYAGAGLSVTVYQKPGQCGVLRKAQKSFFTMPVFKSPILIDFVILTLISPLPYKHSSSKMEGQCCSFLEHKSTECFTAAEALRGDRPGPLASILPSLEYGSVFTVCIVFSFLLTSIYGS